MSRHAVCGASGWSVRQAGLWLPLLALGACTMLPERAPRAPASPVVASGSPPGFSAALAKGQSLAVGVYGVGSAYSAAGLARAGPGQAVVQDTEADRVAAGFVVSGAEGLIVTAVHAVAGCERIVVKLPDQRVVEAQRVGEDEEADIALLRLPFALPEPPRPGRSAALRAGDWVLAIGEPYGLGRSVVAGIVGGKDRHFVEDGELLFIQSDLALNPGNSGGPLLDADGALVGMNTRTVVGSFGATGVSLSIPIEIVMQIVAELRDTGRPRRPRLGAGFDEVSPVAALALRRPYASGALVTRVDIDSLAERMDLRVGDIVVGMNGRPIAQGGDLVRALLAWQPGGATSVVVQRAGRYQVLGLR